MSLRLALIVLSLTVAPLALTGCSENPVTGERQLMLISREEEIALGEQSAPEFEDQFGGRVWDETLQAYVREIGGKIAAQSDRQDVDYEFALLSSDVPNAFALPGGKVYVTAGLLDLMENERQLAAVLGHETTHVAALHNVQGLQRQMGAELLAELAAAAIGEEKGEVAKVAAQVTAGMVNLRYSRQAEYEADQYGIEYMHRAGYNPWGMVGLLKQLKTLSESEPGRLGEMFQTHPLTSNRIEHAEEIIEEQYPAADRNEAPPNMGRWENMQARLRSYLKK